VERRRSLKAEALAALGRGDEAVALVTEELEFARRFGAPGTIGRVLRSLAAVEPDSAAALEHLRESVELLGSSPRRLEYAKSLAALGAKLEGAEAEAMLTQAAQLAEACGADDPCTPARQRSR
jgi:hypothetical protein